MSNTDSTKRLLDLVSEQIDMPHSDREEIKRRLWAADKLCEAAKELLEVQFVTAGIGYKRGKKVVKAIADYEEGRNR